LVLSVSPKYEPNSGSTAARGFDVAKLAEPMPPAEE
jgi:hypothetical protein